MVLQSNSSLLKTKVILRYLEVSVGYLIKRIYFFTALFFFLFCVDQVDTVHIWIQDQHLKVQRDLLLFIIGLVYTLFWMLDWSIEKSFYPLNRIIKYANYIFMTSFIILIKWSSFYVLTDVLGLISLAIQLVFIIAVSISIFKIIGMNRRNRKAPKL